MKRKKLLLLSLLTALLCPAAIMLAQREKGDAKPRYLQQGIPVDWAPAPEPETLGLPDNPKYFPNSVKLDLDSIKFWVGHGSKRAGLVLYMDVIRVVGFRFDGEATGQDMLFALAKEDPRYFFSYTGSLFGAAILHMGWDRNENGYFATANGAEYIDGVARIENYNTSGLNPLDPDDYSWGGWMGNYWRYSVMDPGQDSFSTSGVGCASRKLKDGSWDQWFGQGRIENKYVFVENPIDTTQLLSQFENAGIRYRAIRKPWERMVEITGPVEGWNKGIVINPSVKGGEYSYLVSSIADNAFRNSTITSVAISDEVTKIGTYAFADCASLKIGEIPAKTDTVPDGMYANSPIDSLIFDNPYLRVIGKEAFMNTCIRSFSFGTFLKTIGDRAFKGSKLTDITLPSTSLTFGQECFYDASLKTITCEGFRPLKIPENTFSEETYANATLYVPSGATKNYTSDAVWKKFAHIKETSHIDPQVGSYIMQNGIWYYLAGTGRCVVVGCNVDSAGNRTGEDYKGVITIPDTVYTQTGKFYVQEISKRAFYGSKVTEVNLPRTVRAALDQAFAFSTIKTINAPYKETMNFQPNCFESCTRLENVNINTLYRANTGLFRNCPKVKTFTFPLTEVEAINPYAFYGTGLESLDVSEANSDITRYSEYGFSECLNLRSAKLYPKAGLIPKGMFCNSALERIELPVTVTEIQDSAFFNTKLHKTDLSFVTKLGAAAYGNTPLDTVISLRRTPVAIAENTFPDSVYNNAALVVSPGSIEAYKAAEGWKRFRHIVENTMVEPKPGMEICHNGMYYSLKENREAWLMAPPSGEPKYSGSSVNVPDSIELVPKVWFRVTGISSSTFTGAQIDSLILPATLVTLISLPSTLKYLELKACEQFNADITGQNLSKIVLREGVKNLRAITNCPLLEEFTLPSTLTSLQTISNLPKLRSIKGKPVIGNLSSFSSLPELTSIDSAEFLPEAMKRIKSLGSSGFANLSFSGELRFDSLTSIGSNCFSGCANITKISAPMLLSTASNALKGCTSLSEVEMPSLTRATGGFQGLPRLTHIELPELTTLPASCFSGDSALRSVFLPKLAGTLGATAFKDCGNLHEFLIPENVKRVNANFIQNVAADFTIWHCPGAPLTTVATSFQISEGKYPVIWIMPGTKEAFLSNANYADCDLREASIKDVAFCDNTISDITLYSAVVKSGFTTPEPGDPMPAGIPADFLKAAGKFRMQQQTPRVEYRVKGSATVRKASAAFSGEEIVADLSGLQYNTTYEYRWICASDTSVNTPWHEFSTLPWDVKDYNDGTLWLNEDWYGTDNGSMNYIDSADNVHPRAFRHENNGMSFGVTSQYGTNYGGKLYIVSKQASESNGILTVVDPKTLRRIASLSDFSGADGRAFCGVTPSKGYLSTNNGIFSINLDSLRVNGRLKGSATSEDLYSGQVGDMICLGGKVYAAAQNVGVLVIDAETDMITDTVTLADVASVFVTASGNLYALTTTKNSPLYTIDIKTLQATKKQGTFTGDILFDWGSWRHAPVVVNPSTEEIYVPTLSGTTIYVCKKNLSNNSGSYLPYSQKTLYPYGSCLHINGNGKLMGMFCEMDPDTKAPKYNQWWLMDITLNNGHPDMNNPKLVKLPEYYWFPAMGINSDRHDPTLDSIPDMSLRLDSEDRMAAATLNGADADAMPWQITYQAETSDPGILTASTDGNTLSLYATPLSQRKQQAEVTVKVISNGKVAERRFNVTLEQRPDSVPTPAVDCHDRFPVSTHVTMTCSDPYAAIYYTTDGTDPTLESARYTETFRLAESCTLKVAAYDDGVWSPVATRTLVVDPAGVDGIYLDGNLLTVPEGARVFNAAGIEVKAGKLEKGIYVVVHKGESTKIMVE
ncbi:MAG: leucine-rich repeat protein [Lepagella sp.]